MARVTANEPCKCPDEHKRDIHLQTVGGHHRPAVYCTKCGHITPKRAGAYTTRNEKPDAIELLEHANALNEANATALQRLLDKTVETLEESVGRLRAKVAEPRTLSATPRRRRTARTRTGHTAVERCGRTVQDRLNGSYTNFAFVVY